MFTGIIETVGKVRRVQSAGRICRLLIQSDISSELHLDQSVCHDGVCLTVVAVKGDTHAVELVPETIARSHFGNTASGDLINLERSMLMSSRLDGHLVQGHVDTVSTCQSIKDEYFSFSLDEAHQPLVVEKGSICINGVSLTVAGMHDNAFRVAIIPYTMEHTNFSAIKEGSQVNVEFDILGKYVRKNLSHHLNTVK